MNNRIKSILTAARGGGKPLDPDTEATLDEILAVKAAHPKPA